MDDEIDDIPDEQLWLYQELEQMRDPSFATIFRIVVKVI